MNRAGLYQHPNIKSHSSIAEAYPLISDIVELRLPVFINDVVRNGFTVRDYELFVKMLNEEFQSKDENMNYMDVGYEDLNEEV